VRVKLKPELIPEFKELNMPKILGEHVHGVLASFNKEQFHLLSPDNITYEVIAQVYVFSALFLYRIRGMEYGALVIPIERYR
jgi:hypothetical protein